MEFGLVLVLVGLGYGAYEVNQRRRDRGEVIVDNLWMVFLGFPLNIVFAACLVIAGVYLMRGVL